MTSFSRIGSSRDLAAALTLGCTTALQTVRTPSLIYYLPFLAVVIYALVRGDAFRSLRQTWRPFHWFLVFALLSLASVVWGDYQDLILKAWRRNFLIPGLFFLATCGIALRAESEAWIKKYVPALIATFVLASAVALAVNGAEAMRIRFETVGYYSTYVLVFAAAAVPFLTPRVRIVFYVLVAAGLWWTQQRVSWVMFPLIGLLDWVLNFRCRITVKGTLLLVAAFVSSYFMMRNLMVSRPADAFNASVKATGFIDYLLANERISRWQEWAARAMANPLWGVGYGRENALAYFSDGKPWPESNLYHAHNVLLNHFVQLGLVGLSVFIAAHAQLLLFFWRRFASPAARAGFLVVSCFLVRNLFDDFVYGRLLIVYAGVLGAMVGTLLLSEPQGVAVAKGRGA